MAAASVFPLPKAADERYIAFATLDQFPLVGEQHSLTAIRGWKKIFDLHAARFA
jgi:hypothetical protein